MGVHHVLVTGKERKRDRNAHWSKVFILSLFQAFRPQWNGEILFQ